MQHLSEVVHVVEAALAGDAVRVRSYTELLAKKLSEEGEQMQAHILRCILHDIPQPTIHAT